MLAKKRNDRVEQRVKNNLGIIRYSDEGGQQSEDGYVYRVRNHHKLDEYYENKQHDGKKPWDQSCKEQDHVSYRDRIPRIQYPFSKVLASRVVGKLIGETTWPRFGIQDDPDTEEYLRFVIRTSKLKAMLVEPLRRMCITGSVFVRFGIVEGVYTISYELSKHCYPTLGPDGSVQEMTVAYVFEDKSDLDHNQKPKKKWYRADYGPVQDILYQPRDYEKGQKWQELEFEVQDQAVHGLGFVQGEWFRTFPSSESVDGPSLIEDILDFMDELDYNLSQSSQVIQYNQDPQLTIKGLTEDDLDTLIRSSQKAWNLGREGEAGFLETGLGAVEVAKDFRDQIRLGVQDIARIILMDPEKMAGYAQSGRALEILHQPMIELIQEIRPAIEMPLVNLVLKMAMANLMVARRGEPTPVTVPQGYQPQSLDVRLKWPAVFGRTIEELQKKVQVASAAAGASLISRETMTRWLAEDFNIDDVELEVQRINTQPQLNPFGGGFF